MIRVLFMLGLCLSVLAGSSAALVTAHPSNDPPPPASSPYRYGGKITALRPPGANGPTAPADTHPGLHLPSLPLSLPVFGTDVNVGGGNETSIAANPANPLNFLAGANNTARFTTTDGGQTWNVGSLPGGGDPTVAFDNAGRAYFGELGNTATCPDALRVWKSTDGGLTFGAYVTALSDPSPTDHFLDKEWLGVDNAVGSPRNGRVFITATSFHTPPGCDLNNYYDNRIVLAYSDNQGATWSPSITVSDPSHDQNQFSDPQVASDGTLYVGYQYQNCTSSCNGVPAYQMLARSSDGGVTFSPSITITGQPISYTGSSLGGYQYLYAGATNSGFRHNDQEVIGVSPTNPQEVYALWSDGRYESTFVYQAVTGWHADIVFTRSTDGGTTWTTPIKINDDPTQGKDQFFPWMAVGSDGTIHASWMDRRDTAVNGFPYREYYSQSTDGGLTWSPNQQVADAGGTPSSFIGDYSGLAVNSNNTRVLPFWTDQRSGQRAYTDPGLMAAVSTPTPVPPSATPAPPTATTVPPSATPVPPSATPVPPSATPVPIPPTVTPTPQLCTVQFTDVDPTNPFYPFVRCLACRGIISGYGDGSFRPNNTVTRGQVAKMAVNAAGFGDVIPSGQQTFTDVPHSNPFWYFIEVLAGRGYISGYADGTFRPNNSVTRGQLAKIDANTAQYTDIIPSTQQTFEDVPYANPFWVYIERVSTRGVISGYSCGGAGEPCNPPGNRPYFRTFSSATRGQTSKIVANTFYPGCQTPGR